MDSSYPTRQWAIPAPGEETYTLKTGVRTVAFSYPFTTTDTAVVLTKFDDWMDGQWDIDRSNEENFVTDSMYVGP